MLSVFETIQEQREEGNVLFLDFIYFLIYFLYVSLFTAATFYFCHLWIFTMVAYTRDKLLEYRHGAGVPLAHITEEIWTHLSFTIVVDCHCRTSNATSQCTHIDQWGFQSCLPLSVLTNLNPPPPPRRMRSSPHFLILQPSEMQHYPKA